MKQLIDKIKKFDIINWMEDNTNGFRMLITGLSIQFWILVLNIIFAKWISVIVGTTFLMLSVYLMVKIGWKINITRGYASNGCNNF